MNLAYIIKILASGVTSGTPLLFAALGEIIAERAGVMNLGVEGMMLVGAITGFAVGSTTGNPWLGFLVAILVGALLGLLHALLTITFRANQVACGVALTIFGTGLSAYLGKPYVGVPSPASFQPFNLPALSHIPIIGPIFFEQDMLVYLSYILVAVVAFIFYRTKAGLLVRATGENPGSVDAQGHSVFTVRYACVAIGGALAGAAGAYLSLAYSTTWSENMTAGRGWIAVALVIFAVWDPVRGLLGAYLFGVINSLSLHLQAIGVQASPYILQMLPYAFTLVVLVLTTAQTRHRRAGTPAALGVPYIREER